MTQATRNYLTGTPFNPGGYHAALSDEDAILKAPTGEIMAGFTSYEDAMFVAHCINSVTAYEQAICEAMTVLTVEDTDLARVIRCALIILERTGANFVIKPAAAAVGEGA